MDQNNITTDPGTVTDSLDTDGTSTSIDVMLVLSSAIASVGIISNLTVVVVFVNDKKLRSKIPNIFIINQVSYSILKTP